eukprot:6179520-Pleurochrysis_carterae.AAC.1
MRRCVERGGELQGGRRIATGTIPARAGSAAVATELRRAAQAWNLEQRAERTRRVVQAWRLPPVSVESSQGFATEARSARVPRVAAPLEPQRCGNSCLGVTRRCRSTSIFRRRFWCLRIVSCGRHELAW